MLFKPIIIGLFIIAISSLKALPQSNKHFSGSTEKFGEELKELMGPNLNSLQQNNINTFIARWDSSAYKQDEMLMIMDLSNELLPIFSRPVPQFDQFISVINNFTDSYKFRTSLSNWLKGLAYILNESETAQESTRRYLKSTKLMISGNILNESGSVKWEIKNGELKFVYDTMFYASVSDVTLTCLSHNDSTEIYNVTGNYYPEKNIFKGSNGIVTWEKAGYSRQDVYAEINDYIIDTDKRSFTIDSAKLFHQNYFNKEPAIGTLTDQPSGGKSIKFPQFVTLTKKFQISDIFKGVNYEGGLTFTGATIYGTGENLEPATVTIFRNDTLYLKINSKEFLFSKTGLTSQEASVSLYLGTDSIYHSNLGFSYLANSRQFNLFQTNNPVSKSPYYNSYHNLDMYIEYLSWNMNESKILLSRPRGASVGMAMFESVSFFNSVYFMRLMGMDDYHPLNRLMAFANWYYSETFPVDEFAKWLNRPIESVTGMCIDLANKGFLFYDRSYNSVTIKDKTKDFLDSYAKRKDYDILSIVSETKAPVDNAILNLKNTNLTVNGVKGVVLSDSQKVVIYPYNRQLVIKKNRDIHFSGVVDAGLFRVFGHEFDFSYDTFKISLHKIDSIKISVETEEKDLYGNPIVENVNNLIELVTAELYIDDPENKSGLKGLQQYPIINATSYSYIFYDKIPGLEGIYKPENFYFKVDPFVYENIDHYSHEDMSLSGEFVGGNILKPMKQYLTIQENNSLGFNMVIPEDGIEVYGDKGRMFDALSMSNNGLIGSGTLKYLTSVTTSEKYMFFPDSMITEASSFSMEPDDLGKFPLLNSEDVSIQWLTLKDEWNVTNSSGKSFDMFDNGTTLDGSLKLTPKKLNGSGIINTTDSRITSNLFSFNTNNIKADTADYNLKSTINAGYSFIAENAKTNIDFDLRTTSFSLNTDSSVVKFPEIQYYCTMTDFIYDMDKRILNMEQKGKSDVSLISPAKLIRLNFADLAKPTFFATNNMTDTVSFTSLKGSYHLDEEYIEAEDINYIHVADALIQPENGKIIIHRRGKIEQMQNAIIAVNNRHILHSAKVEIESTKKYTGSAVYDYVSENNEIQQIKFPELSVDTSATTARGYIPADMDFMLSQAFSFTGDVTLYSSKPSLFFTGAAGIVHDCYPLKSYNVKFKGEIDPKNVMIPVSEKPRDINDNLVFSGSFLNIDSIHIYPAFLSAQKSWNDIPIVNSQGYLYYERAGNRYMITSLEKILDNSLEGNMVSFNRNNCRLYGEGKLNYGTDYGLMKLGSAGNVSQSIDSGSVYIKAILALDFFFSPEALKVMSDEIRMMPLLKPVNLNTELIRKGMKDLLGKDAATSMQEEISLFGTARNIPKEYTYELLLNDVNMKWDESTSSFRSSGKIGIGFIETQPINVYVDGYIEIQRRRSGDMIDIYLKADDATWYYFSYFKGVLMAQSGNNNFNSIIANTKIKDRKDPESSLRVPYSYMGAVEGRLKRFLRRMESYNDDYEEY